MSLLHLAPVVTSTWTLVLAADQFFFLRIFFQKEVEPNTKQILTPYWRIMIDTVVPSVVAPLLGTMASVGAILQHATPEQSSLMRTSGAYSWYVAGAALAAGHFLFVPAILPKIRGLQNGGPTVTLRQWMRIHIFRSLTVDLFAWVACMVATSRALSAAA